MLKCFYVTLAPTFNEQSTKRLMIAKYNLPKITQTDGEKNSSKRRNKLWFSITEITLTFLDSQSNDVKIIIYVQKIGPTDRCTVASIQQRSLII
ncbi:hypothetical protein AB6A40_006479 [Gnathostoma spinigerum]|uniref:Uncharacterized protein n=1 Tax=Gnathostoma spinigerum TaxID=75299 RepID=A0ABD6EU40_9BILA